MIGLKNVILISVIILSLLLNSCITSKKCNDKFPSETISTDSIYNKVDTIMVFRDVPYNLPSFNFSSEWWKIADLIDDKEIEDFRKFLETLKPEDLQKYLGQDK